MEATKGAKQYSDEKVDVLSSDSEANNEIYEAKGPTLHRTMKNRHIAMIRCVCLFQTW